MKARNTKLEVGGKGCKGFIRETHKMMQLLHRDKGPKC